MFIALSHSLRRRSEGRTNYMIDSGAHSAPPNGASGGSEVAINMSPLRGEIDCSTTQQIAAFATEGHERKLCQNNKNLRTCYAEITPSHAESFTSITHVDPRANPCKYSTD